MHAYKDAIRRSAGAYIIYPGSKEYREKGFHEIIPGLGAFPLCPSNTDDGSTALRSFILEIVNHFTDRASKRETLSYHTYSVNREQSSGNEVHESLPEKYGSERVPPVTETTVLVGYYRPKQKEWIHKQMLYNIRASDMVYERAIVGASYILLYSEDPDLSATLWEIEDIPQMYNKSKMLELGYPTPSVENYLVFTLKEVTLPELKKTNWNVAAMNGHKDKKQPKGTPFAVTLKELITSHSGRK